MGPVVFLLIITSSHLISPCLFPLTSPALVVAVLEVDAALGVGERCRVTRAMNGNLQAQLPVYLSRAKPTSGFSPSSSARYTGIALRLHALDGTAVKKPCLSRWSAFFVSLIPFWHELDDVLVLLTLTLTLTHCRMWLPSAHTAWPCSVVSVVNESCKWTIHFHIFRSTNLSLWKRVDRFSGFKDWQ